MKSFCDRHVSWISSTRTSFSMHRTSPNDRRVKMTFPPFTTRRRAALLRTCRPQRMWIASAWRPKCHQSPSHICLKTISTRRPSRSTRRRRLRSPKSKRLRSTNQCRTSPCRDITENRIWFWTEALTPSGPPPLSRPADPARQATKSTPRKANGWRISERIFRHWQSTPRTRARKKSRNCPFRLKRHLKAVFWASHKNFNNFIEQTVMELKNNKKIDKKNLVWIGSIYWGDVLVLVFFATRVKMKVRGISVCHFLAIQFLRSFKYEH